MFESRDGQGSDLGAVVIKSNGCVVVLPGEGPLVSGTAGAPMLVKASGEETGGGIAAFEQTTPGLSGPPLHIHHECAETFYILEGELILTIGGDTVRAPKGTFAFVPKGVPHTYTNAGTEPGRLLFWFTPAARMASYFTELGKLPPGGAERAAVNLIAEKHGVSILWDPLEPNTNISS